MIRDVTVALLMSNSDISSNNPNNQETREMDISFISFFVTPGLRAEGAFFVTRV